MLQSIADDNVKLCLAFIFKHSVVYMCSFLNAYSVKWQYLHNVMHAIWKYWGLVIRDWYFEGRTVAYESEVKKKSDGKIYLQKYTFWL